MSSGPKGTSLIIEQVCTAVLEKKGKEYSACNFFLLEVAKQLESKGFPPFSSTLGGQANEIASRLKKVGAPWEVLGKNPGAAMQYADKGAFVVGALGSSSGSGHVFVVATGGPSKANRPTPWTSGGKAVLSRGGAPMVYHGSANVKIRSTSKTQVDIIFDRKAEKEVEYFAISLDTQARRPNSASTLARTGPGFVPIA